MENANCYSSEEPGLCGTSTKDSVNSGVMVSLNLQQDEKSDGKKENEITRVTSVRLLQGFYSFGWILDLNLYPGCPWKLQFSCQI